MIQKIQEENRKACLEYYKEVVISTYDEWALHRLGGYYIINKKNFYLALEKFVKYYGIEEFHKELKDALETHLKNHEIELNRPIANIGAASMLFTLKYQRGHIANINIKCIQRINITRKLISFLSDDSNEIFTDFGCLKEVLEVSSMTNKEKAELFIRIIKLNNQRIRSESYELPVNEQALSGKNLKGLRGKLVKELVKFKCLDTLIKDNPRIFRGTLNKIKKLNSKYPYDIESLSNCCQTIDEGINSAKLNTPEYKDIAYSCFENLGFEYLYQEVAIKSEREYKAELERQRKLALDLEKSKESAVKPDKKEEEKEKSETQDGLTKKDITKLTRALEKSYDFDENRCLKTLSMDEIIEHVAMLIMIKADTKTIEDFIFNSEKTLRQNPYTAYREFLRKIEATVTDPIALEYLSEIKKLVDSHPSAKVLSEAREKVDRSIRYINQFLDNDYSYEYNLACEKAKELMYGKSKKSM